MGEKIYVELKFIEKFERKYLLNPWEMYNKSSRITSLLYKSECLEHIKELYSKNIKLNNIFITDAIFFQKKIFDIGTYLKKDNYGEALIDIWKLGKIYTFEPNFYLLKLQYIMKKCIKINKELLKKFDFQLFTKKFLIELLNKAENNQIEYLMEEIKIKINQKIYQEANIEIKKFFDKKFKIDKINKEIEKLNYLEKNYLNKNDENIKNYLQQYYSEIFHIFSNNSKPLFGYFYNHLKFDLIEKYMLIFDESQRNEFLNLKELSHKSPLLMCIEVGLSIYTLSLLELYGLIKGVKKIDYNQNIEEKNIQSKNFSLKDLENELEILSRTVKTDYNIEVIRI